MPEDSVQAQPVNFWGRRGTALAWVATVVLVLPALRAQFSLDDFLQRLVLEGRAPELGLGPATLYDFTGGGLHMTTWLERGYVPWFTDPHFALRFFRPLGSLALALDQRMFGRAALPSHVAGALLFLAVTAVAFRFFRLILTRNRAGLAAVIFSLASGHSANLAWVAGRHVLVSGIFGALAVFAHVRRRQLAPAGGGWRWVAPLALLLAMLASEASLTAAVIIAAYELFVPPAPVRQRAVAAAPWLGAMLLYLALYGAAGYGVRHSGLYVSPYYCQ
jgi:hypothetical protein